MAMAGIGAIGFSAYKIVQQKMDEKWEEERVARVLEVEESTNELRETIASLSKEDVEKFIESNVNLEITEEEQKELDEIENLSEEELVDPWAGTMDGSSGPTDGRTRVNDEQDGANAPQSENNEQDLENVPEGENDEQNGENVPEGENSKNATNQEDSSDEGDWESGSSKENVNRVADLGYDAVNQYLSSNSLSDNSLSDNSLSDNSLSDNSLSANTLSGNSIDGSTVSGNSLSLKYRQKFRTSGEETELWTVADQEILDNMKIDFSNIKIACIGDSVTAGSNMDDEPDYQNYTYPTRLREALNAESVTNLGIGGSSLGRYWDQAFCDRYQEIPEDTDLIIVMGGYNDGYCLHEDMVGNLEDREPKTLYGDVNDLFKGLKEDYPNAEVIVVTPLPNLLHDVLRSERPELLPQTVIIDCLKELANEYDYQVIDDYNSNFLDSHDPDIVADYIPDSVHPNAEGYDLLAKHIAAEIVRLKEDKDTGDEIEELKEEGLEEEIEKIEDEYDDSEDESEEVEDDSEDKSDEESKSESDDKSKDDSEDSSENKNKSAGIVYRRDDDSKTGEVNQNSENAEEESESNKPSKGKARESYTRD